MQGGNRGSATTASPLRPRANRGGTSPIVARTSPPRPGVPTGSYNVGTGTRISGPPLQRRTSQVSRDQAEAARRLSETIVKNNRLRESANWQVCGDGDEGCGYIVRGKDGVYVDDELHPAALFAELDKLQVELDSDLGYTFVPDEKCALGGAHYSLRELRREVRGLLPPADDNYSTRTKGQLCHLLREYEATMWTIWEPQLRNWKRMFDATFDPRTHVGFQADQDRSVFASILRFSRVTPVAKESSKQLYARVLVQFEKRKPLSIKREMSRWSRIGSFFSGLVPKTRGQGIATAGALLVISAGLAVKLGALSDAQLAQIRGAVKYMSDQGAAAASATPGFLSAAAGRVSQLFSSAPPPAATSTPTSTPPSAAVSEPASEPSYFGAAVSRVSQLFGSTPPPPPPPVVEAPAPDTSWSFWNTFARLTGGGIPLA